MTAWVVAFAIVAIGATSGGDVLAKGKPGGGGTTGSATLSVSPNPVAPYSAIHISGCGYVVTSGYAKLVLTGPTGTAAASAPVDSSGCLSLAWSSATAGGYTLQAYQLINGSTVLMARTSFTCQ
jgi:hypothetical protein